jgi:hypothetical protein
MIHIWNFLCSLPDWQQLVIASFPFMVTAFVAVMTAKTRNEDSGGIITPAVDKKKTDTK